MTKQIRRKVYQVKGLHCPSCELLIEKELLKQAGIESVEASVAKDQVVIYYRGKRPSVEELNQLFGKSGYVFADRPLGEEKKTRFFSLESGRLVVDRSRFIQVLQILGISFLLIAIFFLLNRLPLISQVAVGSFSPLPAFFLFGLVAGISSCAALVGGLELSMAKQWSQLYAAKASSWKKFQPFLMFNFGRLLFFTILGALLGTLGSFFQISLSTGAFLTMAISVLMILLALQMLEVKWLRGFRLATPRAITRLVADESNFKGRLMPVVLGGLTFFLPCGFTLTSQALALASGEAGRGALVMLFFALGTLPSLMAIGFSSFKLMAKPHLSAGFLKIAGVLVLFFGLYNFNAQLNLLGWPSLSDLKPSLLASAQPLQDGLAPVVAGKQLLKMDALAYAYEPNEFKVKAGVPVRWEITNQGVSGCTNAVVAKGLFEGEIDLTQGLAVKEFTPQEPGRYKFSCWMGMVSGVIEVIGEDGLIPVAEAETDEIPSEAGGCGGLVEGSCGGGCGGGCGNPACPYAQ